MANRITNNQLYATYFSQVPIQAHLSIAPTLHELIGIFIVLFRKMLFYFCRITSHISHTFNCVYIMVVLHDDPCCDNYMFLILVLWYQAASDRLEES